MTIRKVKKNWPNISRASMQGMERMGHATTNMLKNVYQHTMSDMQHKLSTKLNENISNRIAQATQNNSEQYEQLSFFSETH